MKLSYKPRYPKNTKLKIGIVGAGEIVKYSHLPAYKMANFEVTAIFDINKQKARALAEEFNIKYICKTAEELASLDCVDIIDIATPVEVTPIIVEYACKFGKHVLCQKPLATSLKQAILIEQMLKEANLKGAINHQMRYSPSVNAAKDALKKNVIGDISYLAFNINVHQPWENWKFWHNTPNFAIWGHTIHYFDTLRYLLERSPKFIYTQTSPGVNRNLPGSIKNYSFLDFGANLKSQVDVNHDNKCSLDDWKAGFRIEGHKGIINGTNGALHNYPHGKKDEIEIFTIDDDQWHRPKLEGRWFPHAFMGTMGELMLSIDNNTEANNSIANGIDTIKMVEASIISINENRPVYLEEL